ncbi:hypothetical protein NIASO_00755 [Niabella soli DSM 19437]|uniref:Uncharacterized protein n=1 Tax=Niabella soli DSM 19437 TaxID=929713 RepID=W0F6G1_9BACT|nr:hypothetical protein NIASO_00755 [Niabella soli DSM 19437]
MRDDLGDGQADGPYENNSGGLLPVPPSRPSPTNNQPPYAPQHK